MPDLNEQAIHELRWIRCLLLGIAVLLIILILEIDSDFGPIALLIGGLAMLAGLLGKTINVISSKVDLHTKERESIDAQSDSGHLEGDPE